ncbi:FCD domain-containing protein [Acuticoccus sp. M5D2P5]|uniref:GntR family transcriptional regulator n=1 Tax=Acuticoccus kalidii TaxID=2910977 RepID=UPI001F2617B8|nr:FCD domain-containing protein [Acuticoccus kalidii]MCF3932943.1 FCD domain-containing protein [Acuticoccus kalidii]
MTKSLTLAQSVQDAISNDILTGRLAPAAWLRLATLQESYGVGLSPLREAMANLVGRGLVIQEGQRGFRIAPVTKADLEDLTETRCHIEGLALRLAIAAGDTEWEANILAAQHRLLRKPRSPDRLIDEEWEELHRAFHLALVEACGSARLLGFWHQLYDQFDRYRRLAVNASGHHPSLPALHERLVETVLARDAVAAIDVLERHVHSSADQVHMMMASRWAEGEPARVTWRRAAVRASSTGGEQEPKTAGRKARPRSAPGA